MNAESFQYLWWIIGGLVVLILIVLFWRLIRRRARARLAEPAPAVTPPATSALPVASLEFFDASGAGTTIALTKPSLTIGRAADNDIVVAATVLNAVTVSEHHAQLRRDNDDYIVRDLGSRNGLTVNGRHTIQNMLRNGDRVGLGDAEAVFHAPSPGGPA